MKSVIGSILLGLKEIKESCKLAWYPENSIPKWSFCYALMVLSIMAAYDDFGTI